MWQAGPLPLSYLHIFEINSFREGTRYYFQAYTDFGITGYMVRKPRDLSSNFIDFLANRVTSLVSQVKILCSVN